MSVGVRGWQELDLGAGGRSLIEASAGTGKTWTIAALYLRLLLEGDRPWTPRQIVVASFTEAAAQELRERLRARLAQAEALAQQAVGAALPAAAADAPADRLWLQQRWADAATARRDLQRLRLAQGELDLAPIATLHGLCRRILADFPFASASDFGALELVGGEALREELVLDLWRGLHHAEDADAVHAPSLRDLAALARRLLEPDVDVWAPDAAELAQRLPPERSAALAALLQEPDLFARSNAKLKTALEALLVALGDPSQVLSETQVRNLRDTDTDGQFKPARRDAMRGHPLLRYASEATRVLDYAAAAPRLAAWRRWRERLQRWREERLAARGQLSFDSLLLRVATALQQPDGRLADALHAAWPVALVDEFQDTDALQYAILDRIYRERPGGAARGRLVMIGDPKQAIYRFRGGDVQAYLSAAGDADECLRLDTNFRSARAYVGALNAFYGLAGEALSQRSDAIAYHAVQASARCDAAPLRDAAGHVPSRPLQLHYWADPPDASGARRYHALRACANHIAATLQAGWRLGERALAPGDIAVLLPGNRDVAQLRVLLQARGVPCVGAGRSNVFHGDWARELAVALHAVIHIGDDGALRAALATRFGRWRYADFLAVAHDDAAWQAAQQRYLALQRRWRNEGVLGVVLDLAGDAALGLPAPSARERALTDLRHLGELLQAEAQRRDGPAQLLAWFASQRDDDGDDGEAGEERQLRLESDAARVRLLTLHASKGLEFPLVFLPLMWDHAGRRTEPYPVLREPLSGRRVIGVGDAARADVAWEEQDERFRVLYVALTRAQHACHVYVLPPERAAQAQRRGPLADPERAPLDASIARLLRALGGRSLEDASAYIAWHDDALNWPDLVYQAQDATPLPMLAARSEPPPPPQEASYSFTALVARHERDGAAGDEGEPVDPHEAAAAAAALAPAHPQLQALAPWRGAGFGNALHAIFERRVVGEPLRRQRDFVAACLHAEGLGDDTDALVASVSERLDACLQAELLPGLRLGTLAPTHLRAEMAFHFALDGASLSSLRRVCARHGAEDLLPTHLPASALVGQMTGKIDLVLQHAGRFHVLDYKSNFLGERLDDYAPARLGAAMDAHAYRFQALLYGVALQRTLRQRLPDYSAATHLGEAIYLFVRAVGLAPGAGVWRQRFDPALLDAVDAVLGTAGASA